MENKIVIGLTPRIIVEDGVEKYFVNKSYVEAMQSIGFNTLMITGNYTNIEAALDLCDGFLVTGGIDVHPRWFNEEMNGTGQTNEELDAIDKAVVDYAVKNKKPMLGICRGHQTINVFMGGSLIQDIGQHHRNTRHKVYMNECDLINFPREIETNSYHHQVVKDLAPGLIELGKSYDGYNEAYISKEYPIICAQWHPEKTLDEEPSKIIFNYFKDLVLKNK